MLLMQYRLNSRMLFITQDKGLSADLLNCNLSFSVKAISASVMRLSRNGFLYDANVLFENGRYIVPHIGALPYDSRPGLSELLSKPYIPRKETSEWVDDVPEAPKKEFGRRVRMQFLLHPGQASLSQDHSGRCL